jgi:uncharacterized protein (DUF3820 family)
VEQLIITKSNHNSKSQPKTTKAKSMNFNFDDESPGVQEALDYVLPLGKYKGKKNLKQLASDWEGRNYLKFMLSTDVDAAIQSLISTALDNTKEVAPTLQQAGDMTIRFGKYSGMALRDIVMQRGGANYLIKYIAAWDKCGPQLKEAIDVIAAEYNRQKKL